MRLPDWLVKIAEIIFKGRQAGLWNEDERGSVIRKEPDKFNQPSQPGGTRR